MSIAPILAHLMMRNARKEAWRRHSVECSRVETASKESRPRSRASGDTGYRTVYAGDAVYFILEDGGPECR